MKSLYLLIGFIVALVLFSATASAVNQSQQVLMIVGYDGQYWYPYTVSLQNDIKRRKWNKIKAIKNPVLVTRQPQTDAFL